MDKLKCYEYLSKINDQGISIKEHLKKIVNQDTVPVDTLKFINQYYALESISTYQEIYNKRHKNPLYKNLVNENSSNEDKAVALSSLLTRIMIRMSNMNEDKRRSYSMDMNVKEISEALYQYSCCKDVLKLDKVFMNTRSIFKELF